MFKILILLTFLPFLGVPATMSPLRLGADSSLNDIQIKYNYDNVNYMASFNANIDAWQLTLCFRYKPILENTDGTCKLGNNTGNFDCVAFEVNDPTTQDDDVFSKWVMSSDYATIMNRTVYIANDTSIDLTQNSYSIGLRGLDNNTNKGFSFVSNSKGVYEVIASSQHDLTSPSAIIRRNYMITFFEKFTADSNNLLVQRQYHCYVHENVYNLMFLGGVIRSGTPMYFIAVVNYHKSETDFLIWEGLSYSRDKVLRDMVGFYPSQGYCEDLFSLYASAPYLDTSENINGTDDYNTIGTSDSGMVSNMAWFYFMQVYRYYDTADTQGDEILAYKINNQFCYALYINFQSDGGTDFYLYNDKRYKHELLRCFEPVLELHLGHVTGLLLVMAIMLILL